MHSDVSALLPYYSTTLLPYCLASHLAWLAQNDVQHHHEHKTDGKTNCA